MSHNIILPDNHYFNRVCDDLDSLITPLKPFGVCFLSFMRYYADGSQIYLSSIPGWVNDYYSESLYGQFINKSVDDYQTGNILWPSGSQLKVFNLARERYDSDNGITFVNHRNGYCDFYFLSGKRERHQLTNFYINHKPILQQFIAYFEDKAEGIITKAEKNRVIIRKDESTQPVQHLEIYNPSDIKKAMQMMRITKYRLKDSKYDNKKLSSRELDCILGYVSRETAEETSRRMNVKRRTVEHYFENIKNKLHCNSKEEIIERLKQDGFPLLIEKF